MRTRSVRFFRSPTLLIGLVALAALAPLAAHADGDKAEYERYEAKKRANAAAAKQAEADRKARAAKAEVQGERLYLGKAAEGRSDAEVHALYQQKVADAKAQSAAMQKALPGMVAGAEAQRQRMDDPAFKARAEAGARLAGGKSVADLAKLSDADLQKLQAELEKKQGRR